jgi:diadenosine tetraphosphatase ApaH/serine/threonine PP2A family protein phosphatase
MHASPAQPDEWDYLVTAEDGFAAFASFATRWCFVGHSHVPGAWSLGSAGPEHHPGAVRLQTERGRRYIVNVGSVGQPRDRDSRAAYAIWDVEAGWLEIQRVAYDVSTARHKIVEAGLPRFLADRLTAGS